MLLDCRLSCLSVCLSVCNIGVLWPNGWMDQDDTWNRGRPRLRPHCVRWGPSSASQKGHSPQFLAHVCCSEMAGWIKMPLGTEVDLGPGDTVLDGDPAQSPQFLAHVCCGQTAGWMKMSLGVELGLGPVHIVLDGDQKNGGVVPRQFSAHVYCSQTAG